MTDEELRAGAEAMWTYVLGSPGWWLLAEADRQLYVDAFREGLDAVAKRQRKEVDHVI